MSIHDPDPAFHFDANPDSAYQNDADPCGIRNTGFAVPPITVYSLAQLYWWRGAGPWHDCTVMEDAKGMPHCTAP
jgi:hypothetical protein